MMMTGTETGDDDNDDVEDQVESKKKTQTNDLTGFQILLQS